MRADQAMAADRPGRHRETTMFLLFFSYGTKLKLRGDAGERACPHCHNTARWQRIERYRYLSVFLLRIARWHREQLDACPVCGYVEAHADSRSLTVPQPLHA